MSTQQICVNCGAQNAIEAIHCIECGYNMREALRSDEQTLFVPEPSTLMEDSVKRKAYFPRDGQLSLHLAEAGDVLVADLSKNTITIGRKPKQQNFPHIDLTPYDAVKLGVSREHVRITRMNAVLVLEDLSALNGTFVNNERISAIDPVVLCDGDILRLGKLKLAIQFKKSGE